MNDSAFLAEILDRPEDPRVWEVYADWLEENGDPRAEYLRLKCDQVMRGISPDDTQRIAELRLSLDFDWLASVDRECAEEAIREALFAHHLGEESRPRQCFVHVEDRRDPSPLLARRLQARFPGLRPVSASSHDSQLGHYVDPSTNEWCILYRVDGIEWIDGRHARARGGYYLDPLAASGETYELKREELGWSVTSTTLDWIS